jgi:hypothetical protein
MAKWGKDIPVRPAKMDKIINIKKGDSTALILLNNKVLSAKMGNFADSLNGD